MAESEWTQTTSPVVVQGIDIPKREEKIPLQECPHCGAFKLREVRHYDPIKVRDGNKFFGLLPNYEHEAENEPSDHYAKCESCEYYEDLLADGE